MQIFNHTISEYNSDNKTLLTLKENKSLSCNTSYILNFHNNQHREIAITSNKTFSKISLDDEISFFVKDIITFSSKLNSSLIEYKIEKNGNEKLMKYWLYHTFLPILFTAKNSYYFLHAGAICIDTEPILFLAHSFGGKSTLTDFFIKKGHPFISDDKVATFTKDDNIYCISSYPYYRPYRKTEDLGLSVDNVMSGEKKISRIFNLVKSSPDSEVVISKLKGLEKLKVLRYSSEIDLPVHKSDRFNLLIKIANKIDIYNITIPWNKDRLYEVYTSIINFQKEKNES